MEISGIEFLNLETNAIERVCVRKGKELKKKMTLARALKEKSRLAAKIAVQHKNPAVTAFIVFEGEV